MGIEKANLNNREKGVNASKISQFEQVIADAKTNITKQAPAEPIQDLFISNNDKQHAVNYDFSSFDSFEGASDIGLA